MVSSYKPLYLAAPETGLVQNRQEFVLPNDAFPILENAFIFREQVRRKQGYEILGQLRRTFLAMPFFRSAASPWTINLLTKTGYVLTADNANPGQVTTKAPHGLTNGDLVWFSGIVGATGYNNVQFTITVVNSTNFTVGADATAFGVYVSGGVWISNRTRLVAEPQAYLEPGSIALNIGGILFTEPSPPNGTLTSITPGNSATINYRTGAIVITTTAVATSAVTVTFNYFPSLPVMGLRSRELNGINFEQLVAFDQSYAYIYSSGFQEFLPSSSTTWTGNDSDFFWSTNYWVGDANRKIFWVTNNSGVAGDPIRYTNGVNGTSWVDFAPKINVSNDVLAQCLAMLPFRGRMMAFNTFEGAALSSSLQYRQRIRWAAIGNPFTDASPIVSTVSADAWKDDISGKGGFLDIPTAEDIVAVGFVRDNLVIYCERSTWQLRYTGRSIAPFQIEKVNSELGAESTFSAVQFDTSLVGIGDKGVVECDSFKSQRIDIKIPDLVFLFNNESNGQKRVHGIRDFTQRMAYWTYPFKSTQAKFPDRRLAYNYENKSWSIFTDSLTTLGTYQPVVSRRWNNIPKPCPWQEQNYAWLQRPSQFPAIVGGNQQGYVEFLDAQTTNDVSLTISGITGHTTTATSINCPNHNLQTNNVIEILDIPTGTPFASSLNGNKFGVVRVDADNFTLHVYNPATGGFDLPQTDAPATYVGGGRIAVRDNFRIVSKKFNFADQGQNIQLGYIDVLCDATAAGAITLNIYNDYNNSSPINRLPQNTQPDTFFNSILDTTSPNPTSLESSKYWHRIFCASRAAFLTIEWTLSNLQLIGVEQESDVQIDASILYIRPAGQQLPIGV